MQIERALADSFTRSVREGRTGLPHRVPPRMHHRDRGPAAPTLGGPMDQRERSEVRPLRSPRSRGSVSSHIHRSYTTRTRSRSPVEIPAQSAGRVTAGDLDGWL